MENTTGHISHNVNFENNEGIRFDSNPNGEDTSREYESTNPQPLI